MPLENVAVVERFYASMILGKLRQNWLVGYAEAAKDWDKATPRLRGEVGKVASKLLATLDPGAMPPGLDPLVFHVQAFHVIRMKFEGDPLDATRRLLEVEPHRPGGKPGWRFGGADPGKGPAAQVWAPLMYGLISGPLWHVIVAIWASLTPETRGLIDRSAGRAPAALDSPGAIAWLDWAADQPRAAEWEVIRAIRGLDPDEADRLANVALDQEEAWFSGGTILRANLDNQGLNGVTRDLLDAIRRARGVYSPPVEQRTQKAGYRNLSHPFAWPADGDDDEPCFGEGFALLPADEVAEASPAVRAGHGEPIRVGKFPMPLLVLLDLDLTRPELAFLGLGGARLRICDWSEPGHKLCYTRVDLDGNVKLMRKVKSEGEAPPDPVEPLVIGPAFASPIADMPWLGWKDYRARIGGSPGWEQHAEIPKSPDNRCPMTFIAQFPHPNGGTAFAFLDVLNLIATVRTQWD